MTNSSMLKYQYATIMDQLILLQLHAENPDCPCSLRGPKPGELGEYCEPKHTRAIVSLARETIAMEEDRGRLDYLEDLVLQGTELVKKMEKKLCQEEVDLGDYVTWCRDMRKPCEAFYYEAFCDVVREEEEEAAVAQVTSIFSKKKTEEPRWCYPVKETDKELTKLSRTLTTAKKRISEIQKGLEMPLNICRGQAEMFQLGTGVLDPYGSRCRDPETGQWTFSENCGVEPAGITTTALGIDGITQYEFEFKIMDMNQLIVSHDPFTFVPNPDYPQELQPRIRERAATRVQVEKIAANLEPEAVITDFHVIDRGTPIIGQDRVVEAGNGRIMGIIRAAADYPERYEAYKGALRDRARDYGLSPKDVDTIDKPVLVRLRISDVDRKNFTQEANQAATIAPSAIENARTDAQRITTGMLQELVVSENESLEDALRAPKNQAFAKRFLSTLPDTVQAALVDAQGYLNRDGVHRMAMAIFVSAFQGDTGLRLAEKAFESVSMDVRNVINAIARSLGPLAQAEALTRSGDRDPSLSIGEDLAQAINVYSAIKRNPSLTVEKYLAQEQIFARELTPFQEGILAVLEKFKGSPRKLSRILTAYAEGVIVAPPPAQAALIPGAEITKEGLWINALSAPEEQPALMEVVDMFQEACEAPLPRYRYLSDFFTESAPEAAFFAAEKGRIERKIDSVLAQLEEGINEIYESSNFKAFVDTMSKFHNYSLGNIVLITLQRPEATMVAGYNTWKDMGRQVKKGEHGIMILAPCFPPKPKKEEEEEEEEEIETELKPIYFKVVHVFDIRQTEGKELPTVEVPVLTGEETKPFFDAALVYAGKLDLNVTQEPRPGEDPGLMGFLEPDKKHIWVRPDVPQDQRTKTLLHEEAHAMCLLRRARDAEVMAESVAYTVAAHFGFDTGVRSFPYVAIWAQDVKVLKANLEIIRKVSRDMIEGIEQVAQLQEVARLFAPMKLKEGTMGIEDFADSYVLPEIRMYAGNKLALDEIERIVKRGKPPEFTRKDLERALNFLEEGGEVISFEATEVKPKRWTSLVPAEMSGDKEETKAGFPLDPMKEGPRDIDRFYSWSETASHEELIEELCDRLNYLGAHLCNVRMGDTISEELAYKCPYIGTTNVYTELGRLRHVCWRITGKLPSSVQVLGGAIMEQYLYAPQIFQDRDFGGKRYIFYKHMGSDKEAIDLVTSLYDSWQVVAIADSRNDIWVKEQDAPLLIDPNFLRDHGVIVRMGQGIIPGITAAAVTGVGIGLGFKFVDWVARTFSKKRLEEDLPAYIDVFKTTIAKHYRPTEDFHAGSIRVTKPSADILVYLGCLKSDKWDPEKNICSPNPTVLKTIVPNTKKYRENLDHLLLVHPEIKVNWREEELGVEPAMEELGGELELVSQALDHVLEV